METRHITYEGVEFEVEGTYIAEVPQTRDYPGDDAEFEIQTVLIAGFNVTDMLTEETFNGIAEQILNDYGL